MRAATTVFAMLVMFSSTAFGQCRAKSCAGILKDQGVVYAGSNWETLGWSLLTHHVLLSGSTTTRTDKFVYWYLIELTAGEQFLFTSAPTTDPNGKLNAGLGWGVVLNWGRKADEAQLAQGSHKVSVRLLQQRVNYQQQYEQNRQEYVEMMREAEKADAAKDADKDGEKKSAEPSKPKR